VPSFTHTKVDPDQLSVTARNIDDSLRLVDNALGAVDESLRNTLHPTWTGPASTKFYSQYELDKQSFATLMKALYAYNEKLRQAAGAYDGADGAASDLVSKLKLE